MYDFRQIDRNFRKFPEFKASLLKALNELDAPVTYSNEDVDRAGQVHSLMQTGSSPTMRLHTTNYGAKIWMK
jgi:hypothetical protein